MTDEEIRRELERERAGRLVTNAGVGAALLLSAPFPSLYSFSVYPDKVVFQCGDVVEAQVRAFGWALTNYRFRVGEDGREYHDWGGLVSGSRVDICATPDDPIGPIAAAGEHANVPDPAGALRALAGTATEDE